MSNIYPFLGQLDTSPCLDLAGTTFKSYVAEEISVPSHELSSPLRNFASLFLLPNKIISSEPRRNCLVVPLFFLCIDVFLLGDMIEVGYATLVLHFAASTLASPWFSLVRVRFEITS